MGKKSTFCKHLTKRTGRSWFRPQTRALQWESIPNCTHFHLWPEGGTNTTYLIHADLDKPHLKLCLFIFILLLLILCTSILTFLQNLKFLPWPYACQLHTSPATWPYSSSLSQPVQASGPCKIARLSRGISSQLSCDLQKLSAWLTLWLSMKLY